MRKPRLNRRILLGLKDCTAMATAGGPQELFGTYHPTPLQEREYTRALAADAWVDAMLAFIERQRR